MVKLIIAMIWIRILILFMKIVLKDCVFKEGVRENRKLIHIGRYPSFLKSSKREN